MKRARFQLLTFKGGIFGCDHAFTTYRSVVLRRHLGCNLRNSPASLTLAATDSYSHALREERPLSDKKAGNRDISDLKARLGLKKGGAAAPAAATRGNGQSGGVVAPPGLAVPPPPAQPVIPNAADDPFAAMNAMAAVAQSKPQKEFIIGNGGKPVEHVGERSSAALILKMAVPGVIALIVGIAIGK